MNRHLAVVIVLAASAAHAAEPKLAALTKSYAAKNALPVRVVKSDLGTRQVERQFVPVLPTTQNDFLDTFKRKNGAVVWMAGSDKIHAQVSLEPGSHLHYYAPRGKPSAMGALTVPSAGEQGYMMALAIDDAQVTHWEGFIDKYTTPDQDIYLGRDKYRTPLTNVCHGGCMWWLVHGEIADNLNIATAMGVRRGKGPEVLAPRLMHAGNELVGPIGIPVATLAEFDAMTDQQLLGPEPAGGAAEQVKE